MTTKTETGGPRGLWRAAAWGGAALLLLTPLVAMRFTNEVQWTGFDFAVFSAMLAVPLLVLELALRFAGSFAYRAGVVVALGTAFLITWSNLAVGIIGNENNPLNQMFFGVIALSLVGVFLVRFRARGMARVMAVTAAAQFATGFVALAHEQFVFVIVGVFALGWLLSAWLFRQAADRAAEGRAGG
jgi:hypothetical protein